MYRIAERTLCAKCASTVCAPLKILSSEKTSAEPERVIEVPPPTRIARGHLTQQARFPRAGSSDDDGGVANSHFFDVESSFGTNVRPIRDLDAAGFHVDNHVMSLGEPLMKVRTKEIRSRRVHNPSNDSVFRSPSPEGVITLTPLKFTRKVLVRVGLPLDVLDVYVDDVVEINCVDG